MVSVEHQNRDNSDREIGIVPDLLWGKVNVTSQSCFNQVVLGRKALHLHNSLLSENGQMGNLSFA